VDRIRHGWPVAVVAAVLLACGASVLPDTEAGRRLEQRLLAMAPAVRPQPIPLSAADHGAGHLGAGLRTLLRGGGDRRLAAKSDAYRSARKALPDRFAEYETKRFIVLSDAKPSWTRNKAQLLEQTYHQFHRYARRLGLKPRPLKHKLVCVLFQEYDDYRQFARAHDSVTADWISGYYSPKHDRVVFYNIETNPQYATAATAADPRSGPGPAARSRLSEEYTAAAIATTVHEAIHQLTFHTRIQSAQIQNPLWISEGLATAFETDQPNRAFGPEHEYAMRREQFELLLAEDRMIPLRKLVTYTQMPDNREETVAAVYHQSYALVTWLSRFRSEELRQYLDDLRSEPPGRPTPERHLQIFEKAFGDVDRLERKWRRYEQNR
jgi:hypothetical protein